MSSVTLLTLTLAVKKYLRGDLDGHESALAYEARRLKAAEKSHPAHDKEPLAMRYALVKLRFHLLGLKHFVTNTDHASLHTAIQLTHRS